MPRYFFDTDAGGERHQDNEGMDLPDEGAARDAAIGALRAARPRLVVNHQPPF